MKKVTLFFAALFVSAMVLTSCGGGASTEATTDSTATEAPAVETPAADTTAAADTTQAAQ